MAVIQAAVIGLIGLILGSGYFFYFDVTPKIIALLAGLAVCALFWRGERARGVLTWIIGCSILSLGVSVLVSPNPGVSIFGSTWRRFGLVPQIAILLLAWLAAGTEMRGRVIILRGIAISSGIAALYGIAQYFGWDPFLPASAYHIGAGTWMIVRPPGPLGYASYFATWLLMGGFLCVHLAGSERLRSWRMAAYLCAGLCFSAMLLTGTRAALLGALVGAAAAAGRLGFRVSRRTLAAALLLLIVVTAFYFSPPGWRLRSRTRWFLEDPWGGARPLLWRDSLRMGLTRPLAGFGLEVFTAAFPRFESRDLARAYPDFAHESAHNIFLDALVSQGLPGLLCLVAACAAGLTMAWRLKYPWLLASLAAAIAAQQFTVFTVPTALLFYVAVALSLPPLRPLAVRTGRISVWAAAALLLYCAFRYAGADHQLELTRRSIAARKLDEAALHYLAYRRWSLPGAHADLWYSRALLSVQAVLPAGRAGLAATEQAEDPFDAWYNLAEVYAMLNSTTDTEACLRRASAANPNWFKPHWMLAQVLRLESRTADAAGEAELAVNLDGGKHPEVRQTMAEIRASQR
jgi:O-antigen ligase